MNHSQPRILPDAQLLAVYESDAADARLPDFARRLAASRAAMLRARVQLQPEEACANAAD